MQNNNLHILLDMDGVLTNFIGGVEKKFNADLSDLKHWNITKELDVNKNEFWKTIQQDPEFWFNLEPYPWTRDLINLALEKTKGNVTIVTSPDMSAHTYAQKAAWVMKYYPGLSRKLFIGPQKWLMAKPNHILIDDSDKNVEKFQKHGGCTILFPQKWNKRAFNFYESEKNPINYIEEILDSTINNIVQ